MGSIDCLQDLVGSNEACCLKTCSMLPTNKDLVNPRHSHGGHNGGQVFRRKVWKGTHRKAGCRVVRNRLGSTSRRMGSMQPADFLPLFSPYLNVRSTCSMTFELLWPRCRMESSSGHVSTAAEVGTKPQTRTRVSASGVSALVLGQRWQCDVVGNPTLDSHAYQPWQSGTSIES